MLANSVSVELLEWARNVSLQAGLRPTLAFAKAFATTDFRVPTLIVHGTADKTVPIDATGRVSARAIPQAKFIEYEGAPHGIFATHKERFTRDLLTFLKG